MERGDEWPTQAMEDPSLAADVLLRLRAASPPDPAAEASDPFEWGARAKRSRFFIEDDDEEEAPVARRTRESPITPLDFSGASGSSDCGGEEGPSAARSGGAADPAAASSSAGGREGKEPIVGGPGPSVFKIPDPKPIRRLMKKQSMAELQAIQMEKELLGENFRLKEMKLSAELQSPPREATALPEEEQPRRLQSSSASRPLPDLNIPLFEELV